MARQCDVRCCSCCGVVLCFSPNSLLLGFCLMRPCLLLGRAVNPFFSTFSGPCLGLVRVNVFLLFQPNSDVAMASTLGRAALVRVCGSFLAAWASSRGLFGPACFSPGYQCKSDAAFQIWYLPRSSFSRERCEGFFCRNLLRSTSASIHLRFI